MAILCELQQPEWDEWLAERPAAIRALANQFPPNKLYRLKSSGHRVTIVSYEEHKNGTVGFKVHVSPEFNFVIFERVVFGIPADGLEECDLPSTDEPVGDLESALVRSDLMPTPTPN